MWADELTRAEAQYTAAAAEVLRSVPWATPLLRRLHDAGGICPNAMPLMFEVRFARELADAGVAAQYEFNAGVDDSTVEFRIMGKPEWLIELVSVRTSQAVRRATKTKGPIQELLLKSNAKDEAQTEEAEMITAEQKIGEKVFADGHPTKFPVPTGSYHLILADMRGYLADGGDHLDYLQMACGPTALQPADRLAIHWWESHQGRQPIAGLFEPRNPLSAAKHVQERIHFIGFAREQRFDQGELRNETFFCCNPLLFSTSADADAAFLTYRLRSSVCGR